MVWLRLMMVMMAAAGASGCGASRPTSAVPRLPLMRSFDMASPVPVTLVNDTARTACDVYLSPTRSDQWGDDWLEGRETLRPGRERMLVAPRGGAWDIRIQDCGQTPFAQRRRIVLRIGEQTRIPVSDLIAPR